jgi:hypothetical protein
VSDDLPPEPAPPPPDPAPPESNPDPVTMEELVEHLARTPEELAALDALADGPDAQALEALKQHLRREAQAEGAAVAPPGKSPA